MIQTDQTRRIEAAGQLEQVNATLNDQRVRSISAGERQEQTEIRAPYAGTVEKLAYTTVGDVVRPAEPIMEIVPNGQLTVVEATVRPSDIDQLAVGQTARIRFTAFPHQHAQIRQGHLRRHRSLVQTPYTGGGDLLQRAGGDRSQRPQRATLAAAQWNAGGSVHRHRRAQLAVVYDKAAARSDRACLPR